MATTPTMADVMTHIRTMPMHSRISILIMVCRKFMTLPDSRIPVNAKIAFKTMKKLVRSYLVRVDADLRSEYDRNTEVVILPHRSNPTSAPPDGIWIALGRRTNGMFESNLQTYIFVRGETICLCHARCLMNISCARNTAIAKEEAQMLMYFAHNAA